MHGSNTFSSRYAYQGVYALPSSEGNVRIQSDVIFSSSQHEHAVLSSAFLASLLGPFYSFIMETARNMHTLQREDDHIELIDDDNVILSSAVSFTSASSSSQKHAENKRGRVRGRVQARHGEVIGNSLRLDIEIVDQRPRSLLLPSSSPSSSSAAAASVHADSVEVNRQHADVSAQDTSSLSSLSSSSSLPSSPPSAFSTYRHEEKRFYDVQVRA